MRKYKFLCPVNEDETYEKILLRSNDININNIEKIKNADNATSTFNQRISKFKGHYDALIFLHQDVYLPKGWLDRLDLIITKIENKNRWGALGVAGISIDNQPSFSLWCSAINTYMNDRNSEFDEVQSLDEVLIIINLKENVYFDERIKGFHLFGTSVVQDLITQNIKSYSIDNPIIHHDKRKSNLDRTYTQAYLHLRSKFKHRLPIYNTMMPITKSAMPLWLRDIKLKFRPIAKQDYVLIDPKELGKKLNME